MIILAFMSFGVTILMTFLSAAKFVAVPVGLISSVASVTGFASYVVGADLLLLIFSSIAAWYIVRFGLAVVTFILDLVRG